MNLNDFSLSPDLFNKLGDLADLFIGGYLRQSTTTSPDWIEEFPPAVAAMHQLTTRWVGILGTNSETFGTQDRMYLPPRKVRGAAYLLVEENQGGFTLTIEKSDGRWSAKHSENGIETSVQQLPGYLVTFALNEMVMGARLWAIDEEFQGLHPEIVPELTLLWSDSTHGCYFREDDVNFYWHKAGAIVASSSRGRFEVGTHNRMLQEYFEGFGLYDIR